MAIVEIIRSEVGSGDTIRLRSPVDGKDIGEIPITSKAEVDQVIAKARQAQKGWSALTFRERAGYLTRLKDTILASADEIAETLHKECGKAEMERIAEVMAASDALQYYAKHAARILKDKRLRPHIFAPMKTLLCTYHPRGVAGIITPWNFPFASTVVPSAQALMAGNTVVIKPSEVTPFSGKLLETLATRAGFPEGVIQVVLGDGTTGAALCEGDVDKIHFTGSVNTGRLVGATCGRTLKACTLELGGKDPAIVCADVDLERGVSGVLNAALFNTGQVCASTERIYVVEAIYDRFVERLIREVKALRQNSEGETDLSCMIWDKQLLMIEAQIKDALEKGAELRTGGVRKAGDGLFLEPTVLTNVDHTMDIMTKETFGPVLPIMKVKDEEEAIRLANDSEFGLSGSIWVSDRARGVKLAKQLESGTAAVNSDGGSVYGAHEGSFGGRKSSGVGYVNGELGLKSFSQAQHILITRFGGGGGFPYKPETVVGMKKFMKFYFSSAIGRWLT
jgi:acyl-CoA reductase-like NAD-dependent aldehyde dehydrogenase